MQKVLLPNRPNLTIAKKARHANRPELVLHTLGIVIGPAKKALAPAIATAKAAAIHTRIRKLFGRAPEQLVHVFHGGSG